VLTVALQGALVLVALPPMLGVADVMRRWSKATPAPHLIPSRYAPLKEQLDRLGVRRVQYVASAGYEGDVVLYYQAQYALAPVLVVRDERAEYVLVELESSQDLPPLCEQLNAEPLQVEGTLAPAPAKGGAMIASSIGIAVALWAVITSGQATLRLIGGAELREGVPLPLSALLALVIGLGIWGASYWPMLLWVGAQHWPLVGKDAVIASLALLYLWRSRSRSTTPAAIAYAGRHSLLTITFCVAAGLRAITVAVTFLERTSREPEGIWDAWAIWNLRARFLQGAGPTSRRHSHPR
jgi:hypothetical protein